MKKRGPDLLKSFLSYLLLVALIVFLLFPFYWTFVTSIKTSAELYGRTVTYWPKAPSFESYRRLFSEYNFLRPMGNSLLVAALTTLISVTVSVLAAYSFSRYRFKGRKFLMSMFLTNNMFPTVLLLIPLYAIMRKIGILYTPSSLVLSYTTFTIPFSIWLLSGFLDDLPLSLEEAAMVDGANRAQAFLKIILPILMPGIVATGAYIFMNSWNEYTFAVMFTNEANRTIPVALKNLIGQLGVEWGMLTAGGIITIIPVCVMFFFAQKRLISGLTAGAVKG
ncbi:MAG: carbohydrate ABC transporter permease [Spirochaetia bacterium]|jgi:multiple sugar transport system permease protein|uniref:ABC transporter, permease protein n=1 Tax=uncultured Spirochaetota bacterium TaxID=460511 RepID=A0A652ZTR8_9SPIR|nr:carbohydrate ABC transporter permease [Spirochaetia bacterium]MCE1208363.1 carbohydrate ABC transporter permease [Spirochaetia bacterium]MDD3820226.1 carbohydrate ABC transporter permease [Spirochaetales bacterium]VBB39162.1 ABC transporter, permease protein [uncultured Spirochaetota bacterium]HOI22393.1 carbohydrate ABC transporter permease [Spirochaetales bacterium]